jgi:hypothetical protein
MNPSHSNQHSRPFRNETTAAFSNRHSRKFHGETTTAFAVVTLDDGCRSIVLQDAWDATESHPDEFLIWFDACGIAVDETGNHISNEALSPWAKVVFIGVHFTILIVV